MATKTITLQLFPLFFFCLFLVCNCRFDSINGAENGGLQTSHATFYGGADATGTMGGACGYGNLYNQGYGTSTVALSTSLFNNGLSCGSCYELRCNDDPKWCFTRTITVTATNFCPPNYALSSDNGGWCNPPREQFDLAKLAFLQIAEYRAGIVPVLYRRCWGYKIGLDQGFEDGVATEVEKLGPKLAEQCLPEWPKPFKVTASDSRTITNYNVVPGGWQFGQTFEGGQF
ncbi:Expansin-A2 [Hibiscus syriacus]|uniref:Expansin n=1 Tax=Hibiscus syriacus TaxID=106335 RepID=A0A6A3BMT9_HIBSY|nr:Expansin-A2 [Hibiscus syriacus]